jgi:hypothetical protein
MRLQEADIRRRRPGRATSTPPLGAYHPEYLVVSAQATESPLPFEEIDQFVRDNPDVDVQARRAMADSTLLHEVRHFHDCHGTIAGVSLFVGQLAQLRQFLGVAGLLRDGMSHWTLPLNEWIRQEDCPMEVKRFVTDHRLFAARRQAFMGVAEDLSGDPVPTDHPWRRVDTHIDGFCLPLVVHPTRLQTRRLLDDGTNELFNERSVYCPVGFQALLEAPAHALQHDLIRSTWPAPVADRVIDLLTERSTVIAQAPDTEAFGRDAQYVVQPYTTLGLLVAKFLHTRCGIEELPPTVIAQLADAALMRVVCPFPGSTKPFRAPGDEVISLLEDADWEHKREDVLWSSSQGEGGVTLRALIDSWRATTPTLQQLTADGRDPHAVDVIESYVFHSIVIPLFELRLKYGDAIMFDAGMYVEHLREFPWPPFIARPGGLDIRGNVPGIVRAKWCEYVLLTDIMGQVLGNQPIIWCGRAGRSIPGLGDVDLAFEGSCNTHVQSRACMHWEPRRLEILPGCVFSRLIRSAAFEPPSSRLC